ncbi:MAG TPA: hypothetical protein P5186_14240 [Candidatus Paceibacterota bacterium]|nr:hypothetical protein [Verrucomicrobiota bacterium]HRY49205.1 hypothetical protein [Candidatus Paceibacterota bacterium]HSA03099.1 hypothetical protein [Candidatus Paceibacterota bacterium]
MKTRRQFLTNTALAALSASAMPSIVMQGAVSSRLARLTSSASPLEFAAFSRWVDSHFWVWHSRTTGQWLQLSQAILEPPQPGLETFSLFFLGANQNKQPQGTYRFYHSALGNFDMFVVPKPWDEAWCGYEAVFNRLTGESRP